jgi:thiamine-monophosphate kinase
MGERRLINDIFAARYSRPGFTFGDDCSVIMNSADGLVVASTDPAPRPVAWDLDLKDYYHWGWLLGAINLSDLAAAGARPLGLLSSLLLPNDMRLDDLLRFLDGLDTCCATYNCPVVGGNIREGDHFGCEATIIGRVDRGVPLSRRGARVDDRIVAIGRSGHFWSALLALTRRYSLKSQSRAQLVDAIVRPVPQVNLSMKMPELGIVHASTDASDGLYYALYCLTVNQGLGFRIESSTIRYPDVVLEVAELANIEPLRLLLGFGDMQLVYAVSNDDLNTIEAAAASAGEHVIVLGVITDTGRLELADKGRVRELGNFDNERLTPESQFTAGLAAYEKRLLERPLVNTANDFLAVDTDTP